VALKGLGLAESSDPALLPSIGAGWQLVKPELTDEADTGLTEVITGKCR